MAEVEEQVVDEERAPRRRGDARRRLALAQIRQYPDPVLRLRANEVETFDEELARLAERMTSLMHDAHGVGLAATQVGVLRAALRLRGRGRRSRRRQPADRRASSDRRRPRRRAASRSGRCACRSSGPARSRSRGRTSTGAPYRLELGELAGACRPARARPPGRRADDRAHGRRSAARRARPSCGRSPSSASVVPAHAARRRGDRAVRRRRARAAGSAPRGHGAADAPRPPRGARAPARRSAGEGRRRAARHPRAPAGAADARRRPARGDRRRLRLRPADPGSDCSSAGSG